METLEMLRNPKNTNIYLVSQSFDKSILPEYEDWFEFDYAKENYSSKLLDQLYNPKIVDNGKDLGFPDFDEQQITNLGPDCRRRLIMTDDSGEVWY